MSKDYDNFVKRMGDFDMEIDISEIEDNELKHYGVMGMKWGVRRYQNKDGIRTSAGKRRAKKDYHEDYTKAHEKKSVKDMSDAELREKINRLQMEKQFTQNKLDATAISKGATYVAAIAATLGTVATLANRSDDMVKLGKRVVNVVKKTPLKNSAKWL